MLQLIVFLFLIFYQLPKLSPRILNFLDTEKSYLHIYMHKVKIHHFFFDFLYKINYFPCFILDYYVDCQSFFNSLII